MNSIKFLPDLLKAFTFLFLILLFYSCKKESEKVSYVNVVPDFLINNKRLANYGTDYDPSEIAPDFNDTSRVLKVKTGQSVNFKDITPNDSSSLSVEWFIDDNKWKSVENNRQGGKKEFNFKFENSRFHKISLIYGGYSATSKIIQVESANNDANSIIKKNYTSKLTSKPKISNAEYPEELNFELFFSKLFDEGASKAEQESIFIMYQDSLNHFISAETVVSESGIQDDLNDLIIMAIITSSKLSLSEAPIYDDGKISYIAISKDN